MDVRKFLEKGSRNLQVFVAIALISEFSYLAIVVLGNLRTQIPLFLLLFGISFLAYWIAVFYFSDFSKSSDGQSNKLLQFSNKHRKSFSWLTDFVKSHYTPRQITLKETLTIGIFFGLLFRFTILFTTPSLSDDIYRYVWDGRVSTSNINPYSHAPESDELSPLRDDQIYPNINHKEVPTIYPPVAQMVFHVISMIKSSVFAYKIGFLLFDLGTALLLFLILKKLSLSPKRLLIYLWNPLIIIEFSGSGHVDGIGILFMTLMLYFLASKALNLANVALALSFLAKFISLIFLPILFFMKKQSRLIIPLIFVILVAVFYIPYADAGGALFSGLRTYTAKWESNASIFALLKNGILTILNNDTMSFLLPTLQQESLTPEVFASRRYDLALLVTKIIIILTFSGVVLYFWRRFREDIVQKGELWPFRLGMIFMGLFIIFMSTVHPWYVCWMVPFLVIVPNRAWLLLSGLVVLSYWNLTAYVETGIWQEPVSVKLVEYLPFFFLLFFDYFRSKARASG